MPYRNSCIPYTQLLRQNMHTSTSSEPPGMSKYNSRLKGYAPLLGLPQEYLSHSREWGPPEPPLKTLCPIDHTKQRPRKKQRNDEGGHESPVNHSRCVNGMQVLFCSFNGNVFQVRICGYAQPFKACSLWRFSFRFHLTVMLSKMTN